MRKCQPRDEDLGHRDGSAIQMEDELTAQTARALPSSDTVPWDFEHKTYSVSQKTAVALGQ